MCIIPGFSGFADARFCLCRIHQEEACATSAVQDGRTLSPVKSRASRARVANTLTNRELPIVKHVMKAPSMTVSVQLHARNVFQAATPTCLAWPLAPSVSRVFLQIKAVQKGVSNALRDQLRMSLDLHPRIHAGSVPTDAANKLQAPTEQTALASVDSS